MDDKPTKEDMEDVLGQVYQLVGHFRDALEDWEKWMDNIDARRVIHEGLLPVRLKGLK